MLYAGSRCDVRPDNDNDNDNDFRQIDVQSGVGAECLRAALPRQGEVVPNRAAPCR